MRSVVAFLLSVVSAASFAQSTCYTMKAGKKVLVPCSAASPLPASSLESSQVTHQSLNTQARRESGIEAQIAKRRDDRRSAEEVEQSTVNASSLATQRKVDVRRVVSQPPPTQK